MKETYISPVCEIILFAQEDIITGSPTSKGEVDLGGDENWGWLPDMGWFS